MWRRAVCAPDSRTSARATAGLMNWRYLKKSRRTVATFAAEASTSPAPRIHGIGPGAMAIWTVTPCSANQLSNADAPGAAPAAAPHSKSRPITEPPGQRRERGRKRHHHEVLDDRGPAERPRQEHSEAAAVVQLQAARDRRRRPGCIESVQTQGTKRRFPEPPPREEPDREAPFGGRNQPGQRHNRPTRKGAVGFENARKTGHIQKLARRVREEHQTDRETKHSARGASHAQRPLARYCLLSTQSYGMKSTFQSAGIGLSRYWFA